MERGCNMGYKALYRTYRPNSFDEVAGQKHIVKTLQNAVEQNKIAHAYLFCGPRGTGKTSIAKIFAKVINCESKEHKPCLQCDNCLAVQNGSHPDIIEIDAASNNGVEEVRNLIEKVKYAPLKGKYKVYIIDEVHMMSAGAFNALLKTIEEPPEHVIFILATTEPHKVLPTIISRCQRFDFTKVPKNEIVSRIHTILEKEHIECDDDVIELIAQLADGGLRDALSILDQCIAYATNHIELHHINEIYGITTVQEKMKLFHHIFNNEPVDLMDMLDGMLEKGIDIPRLTVDLIELLKESIIFEYTKDSSLLHSLSNEQAVEFITSKSLKARFEMIHLLMDTYEKYRFASNVGSYFEVCLLEMINCNGISELQIEKTEPKAVDAKKNVSRETLSNQNETINDERDTIETKFECDTAEEIFEQASEEIIVNEDKKRQAPIKPLDNEYVLGLLAGANKPEKAVDIKQFEKLTLYLTDLKYARYASTLRYATIIASGKNYIVVAVENVAEANAINEADRENEYYDLIVELLGKNKKLFAVSKQQQQQVIQEFKERMILGTLPDPIMVEDVVIDTTNDKEPTQEEIILNLFGEENIVMEE